MTFIVSSLSSQLTIQLPSKAILQPQLQPLTNQNQTTRNNTNLCLQKDLITKRLHRHLCYRPVSTSGNRTSTSRNPPPPPLPTFISPSSMRATNPPFPISHNWTRCCKPFPLTLPLSHRGTEQIKGEGEEEQKRSDSISRD